MKWGPRDFYPTTGLELRASLCEFCSLIGHKNVDPFVCKFNVSAVSKAYIHMLFTVSCLQTRESRAASRSDHGCLELRDVCYTVLGPSQLQINSALSADDLR